MAMKVVTLRIPDKSALVYVEKADPKVYFMIYVMSDVNGALNILRKVVDDSPVRGIGGSGRVTRPVRVKQ